MAKVVNEKEYNAQMREINATNQTNRDAASQAFCDRLTEYLNSKCAKGEEVYWWYDINLHNKNACAFLDYIGMQSGRFDFTYDFLEHSEYSTYEKESVRTGYSGTIDSNGSVSLHATYDTVTVETKHAVVTGQKEKNRGVIASAVFFKGIKFGKFAAEINALWNWFPYFKEEKKHGKFVLNKTKARWTAFFMIMSMILSLALCITSIVAGIFIKQNTLPYVVFPMMGVILFLKIIYLINYLKLDKINSTGLSEGMPLIYVTFPLIALGVFLLGEIFLMNPENADLVFFAIVGMLATAGLTVWHFIEYVFGGDCGLWVSHYKDADGPRLAYIKDGGMKAYQKRVDALKEHYVEKKLPHFKKNFFKSNPNAQDDIYKEQHQNFVKFGKH